MFAQHEFIPKRHHAVLEATIRNHSVFGPASAQALIKMYKLALDNLKHLAQAEDYLTSLLVTPEGLRVSSVTQAKTGLYLQLAQLKPGSPPLLTVGQKWLMENENVTLGNTATTMW